ncbi:MAG: transposase [Dyella sp.]|nr:transposase [Dyella sp.]
MVTAVSAYRRPLFRNMDAARAVSGCMHTPSSWGDASLLCWVLMPDHWHGLVRLGSRDSLSTVMNRFKSLTAKRLHCTQAGLVWDRGFHDRAMRAEEDVRAIARYIVGNPIRAGLVNNVLDYPYWDCVWL